MFRIHIVAGEFLSIFSKYIPAKPDVHAANNTAMNPPYKSPFLWESLSELDVDNWVYETPVARTTRESHCIAVNLLLSSITEKKAVVIILI